MHSKPPADAAPGRFAPFAWVLLDWAASAFSTSMITLIVAYVDRIAFAGSESADGVRVFPWGVPPGVVWAWTIAGAMLATAVLAPWLSAWADRTRRHQAALVASVGGGVGGLLLLAAAPPSARVAVVAAIVVASVGFEMAGIFTGSLLSRIAPGPAADRLSAAGFAAGYAGGALALVAATSLVAAHDRFGLTAAGGLRMSFAFTAAWWLLFSLPAAWARFGRGVDDGHAASTGRELLAFARSLARTDQDNDTDKAIGNLIAGGMLVLGAVQTAISQFSSIALEEFRLDERALVGLVLLVQAVALPGALAVGWLSVRWGRRQATALCTAGWVVVLALAWFVQTPAHLYALAVLLALVLGGVQSAIRAAVAAAAPAGRSGVTFGLLQVGTKLAGAAASLAFGVAVALTGEARSGLVVLLAILLTGWWALRRAGRDG